MKKLITITVLLCSLNAASIFAAENGRLNRNLEVLKLLNRLNALALLAPQNGGIARSNGVTRLNVPPMRSLKSIQDQRNALENLLRVIRILTGVDLEKILKQLQSTIDGSIAVIERTVTEVERLLSSASVIELIVKNFNYIVEQAAFNTGRGVENVLNVLLWILNVSNIPPPLQAVVLFIAVVSTSIPAFLQGLVTHVLEVTESQIPEVLEKLPIIAETFFEGLRGQVEPLLRLLRPIIPGLP